MSLTKRLRFEVLRRDNHTCRYCGATAPDAKLTVDHVVPVALGGSDDPTNLVTACADCNSGKSATPADAATVADVAQDALRWSKAMQMAAAAEAEKASESAAIIHDFDEVWRDWYYGEPKMPIPRPADWADSIQQMHNSGLSYADIMDAAVIALQKPSVYASNTWRYFCGVAWTKLRNRQDAARALIDSGAVDLA